MHKPNVGSQFQAFGLVQHHCILQSSMHGQHDHSCNFRSESALARPKLWQGLICQKAVGVGVYETPNALRGEVKPRIIRLRGLGKRHKHQVTVRTPKFCSRWNEDDKNRRVTQLFLLRRVPQTWGPGQGPLGRCLMLALLPIPNILFRGNAVSITQTATFLPLFHVLVLLRWQIRLVMG